MVLSAQSSAFRRAFVPLWALAALCLLPAWASAQVVWDNDSGNNQWGTAANWSGNTLPTSSSNVQFNATDNDATVNDISLTADRVANSLKFNNVDDNFSLLNGSGNRTLRLTSRTITRTSGSSGNQTLAFTTLAPQNDWDAGWTFDISGSGSLTIASNITGGWGTNVKNGNGTLVLSGNNTFGGVMNINQGVVVAASDTALGSSTHGNTIASGAALHLQNNISLQESNFQVAGSGISNTGAIRNLSGNNTLNASLSLTGATTIGSDTGTLTLTSQLSLAYNLTTTGSGNLVISGDINNSGGVTKNGSGTLTFSGSSANSFTGTLAINDGTVVLNKTAGTNAIGGAPVNIGDGSGAAGSARLRLDASNQIADHAGLITINADGVLQMNNFTDAINLLGGTGLVDLSTSGYLTVGVNSGSSTFGGSIAGTGTFEKVGSGTLTFTENIDFDGTLKLGGGKLVLDAMTLSAGTLLVTANTIIDFGGSSILDIGNLVISAGVTLTIQNWADAVDYFYAQNWSGASYNTSGSSPMNQIVFTGYSGNSTHWRDYDSQITPMPMPVPEPSTYGALLLAASGGWLAWRRRRLSRTG